MGHKLAPTGLTELLLKPEAQFSWTPSTGRLIRFDQFITDLESKFAVVAWTGSSEEINTSKVELLSVCAGPELRDIIKEVRSATPAAPFAVLVSDVKKKLYSDSSPLVMLANLVFQDQGHSEPFQTFYRRVQDQAKVINWSDLHADNVREVLVTLALACGSNNPYAKGHCMAIRDLNKISLEQIVNTAEEFEKKNPRPGTLFPSKQPRFHKPDIPFGGWGNPAPGGGGLFGSSSTGGGSGLFGSSAPSKPPEGQNTGLFGSASQPQTSGLVTHQSWFGAKPTTQFSVWNSNRCPPAGGFGKSPPPESAAMGNTSFEEHKAGFFDPPPANTPTTAAPAATFSFSDCPAANPPPTTSFSFKPGPSSTPAAAASFGFGSNNIFMSGKMDKSSAPLAGAPVVPEEGSEGATSASKRSRAQSEDKATTQS